MSFCLSETEAWKVKIRMARDKAATARLVLKRVQLYAASRPDLAKDALAVAEAHAEAADARAIFLAKEYRSSYKLEAIRTAIRFWMSDRNDAVARGDSVAAEHCQMAMDAADADYAKVEALVFALRAKAEAAEKRVYYMDENPLLVVLDRCPLIPSEPVASHGRSRGACLWDEAVRRENVKRERAMRSHAKHERRMARLERLLAAKK